MSLVHVVAPEGIDDPARPSGGNVYDRRVFDGLSLIGWTVHEHAVPGDWPQPDVVAQGALTRVLAGLPDGALVLLDGLIASAAPEAMAAEARRLRLVVLVHMALDDPREQAALGAAAAIVTTSDWTRRRLLERYGLRPGSVQVAEPGVVPAEIAPGTRTGGELLCVAAVTPLKGHDVLIGALALISDLPARCTCVGSLTKDPAFVAGLRRKVGDDGIADRVRFVGPRTGRELDASYAAADLLVLASRAEAYGMVVTEALARGIPVIAPEIGGLPETLGAGSGGTRPGLLVPPGDPAALAAALRSWLGDDGVRRTLRQTALERRATLADWASTTATIARVLGEVSARRR